MLRARLPFVLLLVPALMAARCKKDVDVDPDEEIIVDEVEPEVALQVVSLDPAWGEALKPFKATLYGAAFERGSQVSFGPVQAAKVSWRDDNTLLVAVPPLEAGSWDITVRGPSGDSATLRRGLTIQPAQQVAVTAMCDTSTFPFDLDSSTLSASTRSALDELVSCLAQRQGEIRLEGHCDSRGTTEYNLALGQRRANAVRGYLISQGVAPDRVTTISFGEERPLESGQGEAAWSANRRVELRVLR